jgi:hypothetical protein
MMDKQRLMRGSSLVLALFSALTGWNGPAYAAQPDYQVQPQAVQSGEAVFRIINLGADNGGSSTARIERLDKAGVAAKDYPIPKLKISEFADIRYALTDPCPTIRLKVTADAKNDVKESNEGNNVWQGGLQCPAGVEGKLTSVDQDSGLDRISQDCPGLVRPAECTVELEPSHARTLHLVRITGPTGRDSAAPLVGPYQVGYHYVYHFVLLGGNNKKMEVFHVAAKFDLAEIQQHRKKFVNRALFEYDEIFVLSRDDDGNDAGPLLCSDHLGRATEYWGDDSRTLIDSETVVARRSGGGTRQQWDVTSLVQSWLAFPADNYGLIVQGEDRGWPDIDAACLAELRNLQLTVTFTVLE